MHTQNTQIAMKKALGTALAAIGFLGFFCEAEDAGRQWIVTGAALVLFVAGAALLGAFKQPDNNNSNNNTH